MLREKGLTSAKRQLITSVNEYGTEGITFCASDRLSLFTCPEEQTIEKYRRTPIAGEAPRTITIRLQEKTNLQVDDINLLPAFELPLANTTFQTGQDSLMYASRWKQADDDSINCIWKESGISSTQCITLPTLDMKRYGNVRYNLVETQSIAESRGANHYSAITMPLVQLSKPRQILASRGNVISRVSSDESLEEGVPASTELELAVAAYLEDQEGTSGPLAVWALVVPRECDTSLVARLCEHEKSFKDTTRTSVSSSHIAFMPSVLIERGATLRRVLSGGGGWGVKAGLLSLDPDTSHGVSPMESSRLLDLDEDLTTGTMFKSIARSGDLIVFYAAPDTSLFEITRDESITAPPIESSIELGVIPSTIDDIPDAPTNVSADTTDGTNVKFRPNHFGILSETGMSIAGASNQDRPLEMKTKLDVPFTRFSCRATFRAAPTHSKTYSNDKEPSPRTSPNVQIAPVVRKTSSQRTFEIESVRRGSFHHPIEPMSRLNGKQQVSQEVNTPIPSSGDQETKGRSINQILRSSS